MARTSSRPALSPSVGARRSNTSRASRFWRSNSGSNGSSRSGQLPAKTFVVPLFLSTSRSSALFARGALPTSTRSTRSTRSVIETGAPENRGIQPLSVPQSGPEESSDMYGGSEQGQSTTEEHTMPVPIARNLDDAPSVSTYRATRSIQSGSRSKHSSRRHGMPQGVSRRSFRDPKVNAKAKISLAFGITLLAALIIYLALAVTGVGRNTMFHVLSILLILTLLGVFSHQVIRMLVLMRRPRRSRHRTAHKSRRQRARGQARTSRQECANMDTESFDDRPPEKPIQIHMAGDLEFAPDVEMGRDHPAIRIPPPVYGNFRTSKRINPDLVHWKHVPPSPLTPTYEEAVSQVQQTMGYRPPSYLSESGVTEVVESQTRDVDAALENIHPLERERMRTLAADALEGRNQSQV
ncbi:uncharacterized protein Z518_04419 [Rhinocladiella mackenziei CBS 650.93]|uniref:Uncharacterized protein n=1 Tax=Rhinocladiella mackenziei CBS 650.93 TaxID=1442369 RepID=A0A0D2H7R9_9EURO|nr:uncharacterized protein Z518_04419 [Rhinocladiella mackenziei CBS 650.93]KIX06443.1 hypothetical protein Z518_04419 [Rhinocladiella mackenziei CBS 650.93]